MKKSSILASFIAILMALGFYQCQDDEFYQSHYVFGLDTRIAPEQSLYQAGDTIWIEICLESNQQQDLISGNNIAVDNATFYLQFEMIDFAEDDTLHIIDKYQLILERGNITSEYHRNQSSLFEFSYGCPDSIYQFDLGIRLDIPGVYALNLLPPSYQFVYYGSNRMCDDGKYNGNWAGIYYKFFVESFNENIYDSLSWSQQNIIPPWIFYDSFDEDRLFFFEIQ